MSAMESDSLQNPSTAGSMSKTSGESLTPTKVLTDKDVLALIRLLDDDDPVIHGLAWDQLLERGVESLQTLQMVAEHPDLRIRLVVRRILEELRIQDLMRLWTNLAQQPDRELGLEDGYFLLAQWMYPDCDIRKCRQTLNDMARIVKTRLRRGVNPRTAVQEINYFLFIEREFRGNRENYYDPENSFINRVLERHTGLPIALSVIYLLLAQRLNLPVYGVGLPGHFIVKYDSPRYRIFIDPFHKGRLLTRADCARITASAGYGFEEHYLDVVSNREILARTMRNLIQIYEQMKDDARQQTLEQFLTILEGEGECEEDE